MIIDILKSLGIVLTSMGIIYAGTLALRHLDNFSPRIVSALISLGLVSSFTFLVWFVVYGRDYFGGN